MFSQGISIVIFIFQLLYILAVSAYPYFLKMPYRRVVVSVSAYPYPVSVQHSLQPPMRHRDKWQRVGWRRHERFALERRPGEQIHQHALPLAGVENDGGCLVDGDGWPRRLSPRSAPPGARHERSNAHLGGACSRSSYETLPAPTRRPTSWGWARSRIGS